MRSLKWVFRAFVLVSAFALPTRAALQVACNISGVSDHAKTFAFKDAMKMCRAWKVMDADSNWDYTHNHLGRNDNSSAIADVELRDDGYPVYVPYNGKKVLTLMLVGYRADLYPFGTFTLMFEGSGEVYLGWDAGGAAPADGFVEGYIPPGHGHTITGNGGTTTFEFSIDSENDFFGAYAGSGKSSGIVLHINRSEQSDPIHNIRVVVPDPQGGASYVNDLDTQPFNPIFLEDHRPFTLLRFMDWGHTNDSRVSGWSDRLTPATCYAASVARNGAGVAYEYMIDLCNLLKRDMWVCVPHQTDENYHHQLAQLVAGRLDSDRKVYVEYSNETWNGDFTQSGYATAKADELGLTSSTKDWCRNGVYQAYQAVRIVEKFRQAFGAESDRVVGVVSGWRGNTDLTRAIIDALNDSQVNPNSVRIDAFATAPYLTYPGDIGAMIPMDVLYNRLFDVEVPAIGAEMRAIAGIIANAGLDFITYEGGQHVLGDVTKQFEFNNDPRMYDLYNAYIDTLDANGVTMFNQFVAVSGWGVHGCWGAKRYAGQPMSEAHKYRALYDYLVQNGQFDPNEPKYWELSSPALPGPDRIDNTQPGEVFTTHFTPGRLTVTPADPLTRLRVALYRGNGRCVNSTRSTGPAALVLPRHSAAGMYLLYVSTTNGAHVLQVPYGRYRP